MTDSMLSIHPVTSSVSSRLSGEVPMSLTPASSKAIRVVCPNCNVQNLAEPGVALDHTLCLRCGEPLASRGPVDLTPKRYWSHIRGNDLPVIVLFWSQDTYEHYALNNEFMIAAAHFYQQARFCKLDIGAYPDIAREARAEHPPLVVVFMKGREVARWHFEIPAQELIGWLRRSIDAPLAVMSLKE